jgi:hypothetical protein
MNGPIQFKGSITNLGCFKMEFSYLEMGIRGFFTRVFLKLKFQKVGMNEWTTLNKATFKQHTHIAFTNFKTIGRLV